MTVPTGDSPVLPGWAVMPGGEPADTPFTAFRRGSVQAARMSGPFDYRSQYYVGHVNDGYFVTAENGYAEGYEYPDFSAKFSLGLGLLITDGSDEAGHGTVTPDFGTTVVRTGDTVVVHIHPDEGYVASLQVNGGPADEGYPYITGIAGTDDAVYVVENYNGGTTLDVIFAVKTFNVTVTAGANGATDKTGVNAVNVGDSLVVTITPDALYQVDTLLLDDIEHIDDIVDGVYTLTNVTADHTIAVTFALA